MAANVWSYYWAENIAKQRLGSLYSGLREDGELSPTFELTMAKDLLLTQLPDLPAYADLTQSDQQFFNIAVGVSAAIKLLAPALLSAHDGLAKLKTPDYEFTFTVPDLAVREEWAAEVAQAVGRLVRTARAATGRTRRPFQMFGAAGVARQRQTCRVPGVEVIRLIVPDGWVYNDWFEGGAATAFACP